MANGDAAVAAGMAVVASTAKAGLTYDEINKTRDYIANNAGVTVPVSKGGTGATTAAAARTALGVPSNADLATKEDALGFTPAQQDPASANTISFYSTGVTNIRWRPGSPYPDQAIQLYGFPVNTGDGELRSHGARITTVTTGYASMSADSSGVFGVPASSRAMKKALVEWTDEQCDRFLAGVHAYEGLYITDADTDPVRPFLILEEFEDAGFPEFVIRDEDGNGISLHYELVTVALLAITRRHNNRLTALEQRMQELEERTE